MSNRILSYRGLLTDGAQDTILLTTKKGEVGYRITKFETIGETPGVSNQESITKIWKEQQTTVDGIINFSDNRLLAAAVTTTSVDQEDFPLNNAIIFDQEIVNQDIYVTHKDVKTGESTNYYIELEVIKLSEDQAMVATLKDIRNNS
tara:strand:+ start:213 stop:653 length:441 start_codon:yes stop_codon:yes gene_type:complete